MLKHRPIHFNRPRLLVSVQNVAEALIAHRAGADLIDFKNPAQGALGRVSQTILNQAWRTPALKNACFSTANGELHENQAKRAHDRISYYKLGLGGCATDRQWAKRLAQWHRPAQEQGKADGGHYPDAVAVGFADEKRAQCPALEQVLDWGMAHGAGGFLIDTAIKDGKGLWHWVDEKRLGKLIARAQKAGLFAAVAGSLEAADIPRCLALGANLIGVRGAACDGSNRQAGLSSDRVAMLKQCF